MSTVTGKTAPERDHVGSSGKASALVGAGVAAMLALGIGGAGCAAGQSRADEPGAEKAEAGDEAQKVPDGVQCRQERPTGSNISRQVCRDEAAVDERRHNDQQMLHESSRWGQEN